MDEQYTVARKMYMSYILQGNEIGYIDGQMKSILLIYQQDVATDAGEGLLSVYTRWGN